MRRKSKAAELFVLVHRLQICQPQPLLPQSPTKRKILSSLALTVFRLKHPLIYIPGDYFLPQASSTSWSSRLFKFSAKESCWRTVCLHLPFRRFSSPIRGGSFEGLLQKMPFCQDLQLYKKEMSCPVPGISMQGNGQFDQESDYDTSGSWKDASLVRMAETNRLG